MDINERIYQIIQKEGVTVSAFARKVGVGDQTIRGIVVQKRNKPGFELMQKIIQTFDWLDLDWFMTGKGEMVKDAKPDYHNMQALGVEYIDFLREKDEKIEKLIEEKVELRVRYQLLASGHESLKF